MNRVHPKVLLASTKILIELRQDIERTGKLVIAETKGSLKSIFSNVSSLNETDNMAANLCKQMSLTHNMKLI